jgi:hypothetical protein
LRASATCESRLTTAITLQPMALATCTNINPIGPPPITATVSPISTPVSCRPRRTQASGSVIAASSKLTFDRHDEHIGFHNAPRNPNVLGVRAIVEQQIFAEV